MRIDDIKALDPKRVIVLDTETTGLKPYGNDEILSLTIIDLEGTVLFNELVKPEKRKSWPKSQEVHGITPAMVKDKQPLSAYREQLQELWKNIDLVVGYNIPFDSDFIYASSLNLSPHVEEFDVMREFAPIWGKWDEYHEDYRWAKLVDCAKHYKIGDFEAHSSLGDTEATRKCFLALIDDPEYVSSKHAIEALRDRNRVTAPEPKPVTKPVTKPVNEKPEKQSGKRDIISTVLTVLLAIVAVLAITSLFSEWQMAVTYGFLFIVLLLVKAYRDGRNNAK